MSKDDHVYRDPGAPAGDRVDDLLGRMALREKVGQLAGTFVGSLGGTERTVDDAADAVREHGLGTVGPFIVGSGIGAAEAAAVSNRLQRAAVEGTRLGIPLLIAADAVHGHAFVEGTTVFPHNLAMAATRDPGLVREVAAVTRREMRATGVVQNYNPTADVARDPRWGRVYETYGESPRLCADLVAAEVEGYQGDGLDGGVVATPKHFPAYGDGERGQDAAPVEVSDSTLWRSFLPPFAAAVEAGARSVMPCYNSIGGEPVHGSRRFLTGLLRERLGFRGYVVSDWRGIGMLHDGHHTASSPREAAWQAARAGVDVASVAGPEHADRLLALVKAGELSGDRIDASVRRVLRAKVDLGLFEDPYADPDGVEVVAAEGHADLALDAAREAMTLLKNEGDTLPFPTDVGEVLVAGPNADDLRGQVGGWTVLDPDGTTVLEGVRDVAGAGTTVRHERGAGIDRPGNVGAARDAAADADAAVVVLGENWYIHEFGPEAVTGETGSFPTRSEIALPDPQRELLRAVHGTGTPTALVLISGRPLAVPWATEHVPAILMAYYPGARGGTAVAETLFGANEPGGSLPVSVPRSAGHLPTRFNHLPGPRPLGAGEHPPAYDPLFEFGRGLSYTEFDRRDLSVSPGTVGPEGTVEVSMTVENVGDRPGATAVHCYLRDDASSRVTPVRELAGVRKVRLEAGASAAVTFAVPIGEFGTVGPGGERTVEPGTYTVIAGDMERSVAVERDYR